MKRIILAAEIIYGLFLLALCLSPIVAVVYALWFDVTGPGLLPLMNR